MNPDSVIESRQRKPIRSGALALLFSLAALASGCASTTLRPDAAAQLDCGQLRAAIGDAEKAKQEAVTKQQDAWKAVIPFAVVARYASGKSAVGEADAQLDDLNRKAARQGCPS